MSTQDDHLDGRRLAAATQRNRAPILEVLSRVLPTSGVVLEVASGTGEHAAWFAQQLRPLRWQPSDPDPVMRASIAAHGEAVPNTLPPLDLDAVQAPWPLEQADGMVCINLLHIAPWSAAEGLMAGAGRVLSAGGVLFLYGPFNRAGRFTSDGNAIFDHSLREEDPQWGLRDVEAVVELAALHGLSSEEIVEMPANNLSLIFRRD